jgi:hypothetical protein
MNKKYGIWTLVGGEWKLVSIWAKKSDAQMEVTYLTEMLGMSVKLFVKVS